MSKPVLACASPSNYSSLVALAKYSSVIEAVIAKKYAQGERCCNTRCRNNIHNASSLIRKID